MRGRHRFGPRDAPIRRVLAASVPVVAIAGMTVAVLLGGGSPAGSAARIAVPGFGSSDAAGTSSAAPSASSATALSSALPVGAVPAVTDVSFAGSTAVQRIKAERAEAAERARIARQRAAEERAARERAAQERAAQARVAQERADALQAERDRAAQQQRDAQRRATPSPSPSPSATPDPRSFTGNDGDRDPLRPGGLFDSLLRGRGN